MFRVGYYRSFFDPPDCSLVGFLETVVQRYELDKLILAVEPTGFSGLSASAEERIGLCLSLFSGNSVIEIRLHDEKAYSSLMHSLNDCDSLLLISDDSLHDGIPIPACKVQYLNRSESNAEYGIPSVPDIQRMLFFGMDELVPPQVLSLIRRNRLYGSGISHFHLSVEELLRVSLALHKQKRVSHVLGCCELAKKLAERFSLSVECCVRAAVLHDVTKALSDAMQLILFQKHDILLSEADFASPQIWHAISGACVAETVFGEDANVVQAIRRHTTGAAEMTDTDLVIYLADLLEPTRSFSGVEPLREITDRSLYAGFKASLEHTINYLNTTNVMIHPDTLAAYGWIQNIDTE